MALFGYLLLCPICKSSLYIIDYKVDLFKDSPCDRKWCECESGQHNWYRNEIVFDSEKGVIQNKYVVL